MRPRGAAWRIVGSAVSWFVFAFCFTVLWMSASAVMGLGGFCASGGPYEIEVECPAAVAFLTPLSIYGGLAAVALGAFVARGFGVPLVSWAWPILFIGLGTAFLFAATAPGGIVFGIIGVVFVTMGAVPLVMELRADARGQFIGSTNALDEGFERRRPERPSVFAISRARGAGDGAVTASAADGMLSLALCMLPAGTGVWAGMALFSSL